MGVAFRPTGGRGPWARRRRVGIVFSPLVSKRRAPLSGGPTSRGRITTHVAAGCAAAAGLSRQHSHTRSLSPPSPCHMYIGENFSVRLHEYFRLGALVRGAARRGIVHTEFDPFKHVRKMSLSAQAQKMRDVPNAGGSSVISEVLSYEVLRRCFNAQLLKTEMEVSYFPVGGSITDYTVQMFGTSLGVSVTRAMKYRGQYTAEDAHRLLNKKLNGVVQSSCNTLDTWSKQILHVWATSRRVAHVLEEEYAKLRDDVTANTVVLVTVANTASEIFTNA